MPSPLGDLTILARSLQQAPSILGTGKTGEPFARVLSGKNKLTAGGAPFRFVMFPVGSANHAADDRTVTISSSWMLVTFHFWAPQGPPNCETDPAFDLRERWFQAMRHQADLGGYFWKMPEGSNERWDITPDDGQQGQEFEIDALILIDADLPTKTKGRVAATSLNRVPELTSDIGTADSTIPVEFTYELPASGVIYIDDEKITYTGVTDGAFTGVTRGADGTVAATHASGAPVYVALT